MKAINFLYSLLSVALCLQSAEVSAKEWSYGSYGKKALKEIQIDTQSIGIAVIASDKFVDVYRSADQFGNPGKGTVSSILEGPKNISPPQILGKTLTSELSEASGTDVTFLGVYEPSIVDKPRFPSLIGEGSVGRFNENYRDLDPVYDQWRMDGLDGVLIATNLRKYKTLTPTVFSAFEEGHQIMFRADFKLYYLDLNNKIEYRLSEYYVNPRIPQWVGFPAIGGDIDKLVLEQLKRKWLEPNKKYKRTYSRNELENHLAQDIMEACGELAEKIDSELYEDITKQALEKLSVSISKKLLKSPFGYEVSGELIEPPVDFESMFHALPGVYNEHQCSKEAVIKKYDLPIPEKLKWVQRKKLKKSSKKR